MSKITDRNNRLMPNGQPRYIRCYDNEGKTWDRYTVVYTGRYPYSKLEKLFVSMDSQPFDPQGFCQHGSDINIIDRPTYSHLGKKIKFEDLPEDCQKVVLDDYKDMWNIK